MKLLIIGPNGKMGKAIVETAYKNPNIEIIGGVAPIDRDYIGSDIGVLCGLGKAINAKVYSNIEDIIDKADMVVECTMPEVSISTLKLCVKHKKSFVSGTTGFSEDELNILKNASSEIPLLLAANTSRLTHILYSVLKNVCKNIPKDVDIDIVDFHDNKKLDAPSGTGKEISRLIAKELGYDITKDCEYGRNGRQRRRKNTIAFNSIRSGGTAGSIKVIFGFEDENMELTLNIFNMKTFAKGIIDACLYLNNKSAGFYTIEEVFKIN